MCTAYAVGSEHKELPIIGWSCNIRFTFPWRHWSCSASLCALLGEGKFSKPVLFFKIIKDHLHERKNLKRITIIIIIISFLLFLCILQLDLFTTLKALSLLGVFLLFVGHRTLSHLAAASNKLKSA